MKKIQWKRFCMVITLMAMVGFSAQIYGAESMSIAVGNVGGNQGDTVSVDVVIKGVPTNGFASGILNVDYDTTKIKFKELKAGDIVCNKESDITQSEAANGLKIMYSDNDQTGSSYISKDGLFCSITFEIFDTSAGDINLKLYSDNKFYDKDVKATLSTPPLMTSGKITVLTNKMVLKLDDPKMVVNGKEKNIDPGYETKPYINEGRTFVPIRAIIEEMGGNISWDAKDQRADVVLKDTTIKLWINNLNSTVNDKKVALDVVPHINSGRTMLPLRFVTENLGCKVDWDGQTRKITISY